MPLAIFRSKITFCIHIGLYTLFISTLSFGYHTALTKILEAGYFTCLLDKQYHGTLSKYTQSELFFHLYIYISPDYMAKMI